MMSKLYWMEAYSKYGLSKERARKWDAVRDTSGLTCDAMLRTDKFYRAKYRKIFREQVEMN